MVLAAIIARRTWSQVVAGPGAPLRPVEVRGGLWTHRLLALLA
jgi:hypothetical protein